MAKRQTALQKADAAHDAAMKARAEKIAETVPEHVMEFFMPGEPIPERPLRRGRPKHEPKPWQKALIRYLSGLGVPHRLIASEACISVDTMYEYYRAELDEGMERTNMLVTGSLFKKAISDTHPQAVTAAIWWDKTRGGHSETVNVNQTGGQAPEEITAETSAKDAAAAYQKTLMGD